MVRLIDYKTEMGNELVELKSAGCQTNISILQKTQYWILVIHVTGH